MREPGGDKGYQKAMNKPGKPPVPHIAAVACALVLSVAGLAPVAVTAQDRGDPPAFTVEGEVLDAATGVPVEAAIVTLIGLSASDVSNELGYFRLEEIPVGSYAIRALRLGYRTLEEEVSIEGEEVLTIHLTPGPVPLRGIEVEVVTRDEYALRAVGTASHGLIGPAEMEDLRQRYLSLHQVLRTRRLPRARYHPPMRPGETGCLRLTAGSLSGAGAVQEWGAPRSARLAMRSNQRGCAAVVLDGVWLGESRGWAYDTHTQDIESVRFLHGAEATLQYGHRGAYGVLLIETRRVR